MIRACALAGFSRSGWYKRSTARDQTALRLRIRDLAHARPRFGYNRIWVLLRREGWLVNRKRVRRLYRLDGLQERWSMDFVHDQLADGRPFRVLTVVDQWSRQSPILEPALGIGGRDVAAVLDRAIGTGPAPRSITVDHGTEFMSRPLEDWAYQRGIALDFIRPGKPVENAHIESFKWPAARRVPERAAVLLARGC